MRQNISKRVIKVCDSASWYTYSYETNGVQTTPEILSKRVCFKCAEIQIEWMT